MLRRNVYSPLTLDGHLVITPPPRKSRQTLDIVQWGSSFLNLHVCPCVVLSRYRYPALMLYNLLILRSAAQFDGDAWRNSDETSRDGRRGLTDWFPIHVALSHVHTTFNRLLRSSIFRQPVARVRRRPFFFVHKPVARVRRPG